MAMKDTRTLETIVGPWEESAFESGLIARCREAWAKPLEELNRSELATLLRQRIAIDQLIPVAKKKIEEADDDTEIDDRELAAAITYAENS